MYPYRRVRRGRDRGSALLLVAAITGLALVQARRRPWLLVGWLWFAGHARADARARAGRRAGVRGPLHVSSRSWGSRWRRRSRCGELCRARARRHAPSRRRRGARARRAASRRRARRCAMWRDQVSLFEHAIEVDSRQLVRAHRARRRARGARRARARAEGRARGGLGSARAYARALGEPGRLCRGGARRPERALAHARPRARARSESRRRARWCARSRSRAPAAASRPRRRYRAALEPSRGRARDARCGSRACSRCSPEPALRDGARGGRAVRARLRGAPCESAEELDVCAMAAMEAGRQAEAIDEGEPRRRRSRARAATSALARKIAGRLAGYQRGQPAPACSATPSGVAPER